MNNVKKLKLFEMFAGFGGASFSLKKAGIDFETVGYSEIDRFAIKCYEQNHNHNKFGRINDCKNYGDATKINVNELPEFDLLTGGFPCQAFSVAGKGLGEKDTRGTLFHEIIRIAEVKKPKYMLLENVKGLTTKKHKETFEKILSELDRIGYNVKWKILNSKDYGIPQNRERVWFACFRKGNLKEELKDAWFFFPKEEELKVLLKDILENEVDKKYYLSEKQMSNLIKNGNWNCNPSGKGMNGKIHRGDIAPTLTTNKGEGLKIYVKEDEIRKLTPTECFRLMGFLDDQINLKGISNRQRYILAGNGWDVNMVCKIFKELIK